MTSNAVNQLVRELKELKREPLVGANAEPLDSELKKWYCLIMGSEGTPYAGIPIRFILEFPDTYPNDAPKAFFDTEVRYSGGASYKVDGRLVVCLNIFGNFGHVHTEWKNEVGSGWSPSYGVQTILVTMQGLMMSDMLSTSASDIKMTRESAFNFKCLATGHDGSDPKKYFPRVFTTQEEIEKYKVDNNIVKEKHVFDPLRDHYICYVTKKSIHDGAVLGYGVHLENAKIGMLSSACEYVSKEAFNNGTRNSSTKKPFEFWFPILTHTDMWAQVKPEFVSSMKKIGEAINCKKSTAEIVFKVCSSIMNTLVVEIMNNKNNLTANDKFVDGYFAIFRLIMQYAQDDKDLVKYADSELTRFKNNPDKRNKTYVQNMGELLIFLLVSSTIKWKDIAAECIAEIDARNVFWYAVGTYNNRAKCPELLNTNAIPDRAVKVFNATEVSRQLVMYQVRFSQVAKSLTTEILDSNNGLAPMELRVELKDTYKEISKISDLNGYFKWLSLPELTNEQHNARLIEAIKSSERSGYHSVGGSSKRR